MKESQLFVSSQWKIVRKDIAFTVSTKKEVKSINLIFSSLHHTTKDKFVLLGIDQRLAKYFFYQIISGLNET
jgi:hypothetical protein